MPAPFNLSAAASRQNRRAKKNDAGGIFRPAWQRGFTLIELMVVISIMTFIASIMLVAFNSARSKARDAKRLADIRQLREAVELYYDKYGVYPPNEPDLASNPIVMLQQPYLIRWDNSNTGNSFIPALISEGLIAAPIHDPLESQNWGYRYIDGQQYATSTSDPTYGYGVAAIGGECGAQFRNGVEITFGLENPNPNADVPLCNQISNRVYCICLAR